jgi:DNA (cytosine-5)-methyltransferase 1
MSKPEPTAIDLFAGCGGLTCGLKQAGFRVIGAVEVNDLAAKSYRENHRRVSLFKDDIRKLDPEEWMKELGLKAGDLDLLAGCPPCQGFSTLRTRNGAKRNLDRRNNLVQEMARLVSVFRPKAILMENVPGLRSKVVFRDFVRVLRGLGYTVPRPEVHDVVDYGVPQRRKRLVLAAGLGFEIPFARTAEKLTTVRETIEDLPAAGKSGDYWHDLPERRSDLMSRRIAATPKDGGSRSAWPKELWWACHTKTDGFKDICGRMKWDDAAPTITGGCFNPSKGRFVHPEENRCITIREAALLQTFPKNYKFAEEAGKQGVALMIGNAIPPEFVRRQGKAILEAIRCEEARRGSADNNKN